MRRVEGGGFGFSASGDATAPIVEICERYGGDLIPNKKALPEKSNVCNKRWGTGELHNPRAREAKAFPLRQGEFGTRAVVCGHSMDKFLSIISRDRGSFSARVRLLSLL